jgi:hypothetical protein
LCLLDPTLRKAGIARDLRSQIEALNSPNYYWRAGQDKCANTYAVDDPKAADRRLLKRCQLGAVLPRSSKTGRHLAQPAGSFTSPSSKSQAARVLALFLARAIRKASQRIPDKVIDSINIQMMVAIGGAVILFIASPSHCGPIRRRDEMAKKCSGVKNLLLWSKPVAVIV